MPCCFSISRARISFVFSHDTLENSHKTFLGFWGYPIGVVSHWASTKVSFPPVVRSYSQQEAVRLAFQYHPLCCVHLLNNRTTFKICFEFPCVKSAIVWLCLDNRIPSNWSVSWDCVQQRSAAGPLLARCWLPCYRRPSSLELQQM